MMGSTTEAWSISTDWKSASWGFAAGKYLLLEAILEQSRACSWCTVLRWDQSIFFVLNPAADPVLETLDTSLFLPSTQWHPGSHFGDLVEQICPSEIEAAGNISRMKIQSPDWSALVDPLLGDPKKWIIYSWLPFDQWWPMLPQIIQHDIMIEWWLMLSMQHTRIVLQQKNIS